MPIYSPTGFLDITNATLRTSNVEAENLLMTGGNIYVTSELEADATVLNLENVTRKGNVSSNTIHITNATTGIIATGNVEAAKFIGSGSHLTGIPPSAITGTLSQWSDGNNNDVYIASNVGIGNVHTLTSNTLQVGGNLYVRDTGSNVLTVNGNVVANYFEGDGSKLSGIVTDLQGVTDNGNVTTNVVQFSNATTGLVTTANIEVGGDLKIDGLTAGTVPYVAADKFLKDSFITTTGDATVISSNLDVTGNIFMRGNKFIVESETKLINDAIIGIANNNTSSTTDKGIIMQNPISATTGNVAIIHHGTGDGFADQLTFGYTDDPLDTVTVTNDLTKELTVNVLGNVITQNNLSVGGTLSINNITAAAQHSLQAVTNVGNVTSNTVQFSNAITSLTASSNIVATGNVSAGHDTNTTSYFGRAAVGYMGQNNQASFAHVSHNTTSSYALKQTAGGPTYINTPASGHIRFTVNDGNSSAEKMRITSAGKVGIGVNAPDATLHVVGNAYVSSNLTVSGNVEVGTANLFVDTANSRIGIGNSDPDATLHVVGNAYVSSDLIVSSDVRGGYDTNTTSYFGRAAVGYCGHGDAMSISHIDSNDTGGYALLQEANGATMLNSASGQSVHIRQGNVNKLTIDSSGNVGIGAHSPMSLLHLHELDGEGVHRSLLWTSKRTNNQEPKLGYLGTADAAYASGALGLFKNTMISGTENEAVRIQGNGYSWFNGGNVGINKTNPGYILDVHSDDAIHIEQASNTTFETKVHGGALFIRNPSTSSGYEHFIINNHATGNHTTSYIQFRRGNSGNGSAIGTITGNGSTISYGTGSDYRLKENIVPMPISGLDTINNLQPKRFNFIGHPDDTYDGFIAHELQEHIPMAVTGVKDEMCGRGNVVKIDDESIIVKEDVSEPDSLEEGTKWVKLSEVPVYQNVDLSKIVTYLVKAVQELSEENQTLKTRLDALENAS